MPARWNLDAFVPVEPDRAYAWMIDFRHDDHERPAYKRAVGAKPSKKPSMREVLSRDGDTLRLRDTWNGKTWEATVTLLRKDRALLIEGAYGYRARWWVEENPGGARIRVEGEMAPSGVMKLLVPLFAKGMVREMETDFRGHVADMLSELNPGSEPIG